jgi:ubiquinone/menaquinone biosynthesis C-methylase UbiE
MKRILEPELMDDEHQSLAYAKADFSASNQWFVDQLRAEFPQYLERVVDLGCGPADVLIRLAKAAPDIQITAIDGSRPMITLAQRAVRMAGLEAQIKLMRGHMPGLPLEEHSYDAVLSKDLLHHLPDPSALWKEAQILGRPGALVFVMDLCRPETPDAARRIVDETASTEDPVLKRDFYNSLCAAFTVDEVKDQLRHARQDFQVAQVSERHMLVKGVLVTSR